MKAVNYAAKFLNKHEVTDRYFLIKAFKAHKIICDPQVTPWCAYFVCMCERAVGNPGTGSGLARSYLKYGWPVELKEARLGDICVFKRANSSVLGHVSYFITDNGNGTIECLGGNQKDRVCYATYPLDSLLGIRRY